MDSTLWNLEDKFKLSTQKVIVIFAFASFLVIGIVTILTIRKLRRKGMIHQEPEWRSVKKVLMGSIMWSGPNKCERETPSPLIVRRDAEVGWQSHNSSSGVWQRPILMGEKCELPRFSGLILYDQKGMPVHGISTMEIQEKRDEVVRTTLADLL